MLHEPVVLVQSSMLVADDDAHDRLRSAKLDPVALLVAKVEPELLEVPVNQPQTALTVVDETSPLDMQISRHAVAKGARSCSTQRVVSRAYQFVPA